MQIPKFSYRPKSHSVSYMEVTRAEGHTVKAYHMHDHEEVVLIDSENDCKLTNNGNALKVSTPAILLNRAGTFHETETVYTGSYHSRVVFFHPQNMKDLPEELQFSKLFESDMTVLPLTKEQLAFFTPLFDQLKTRPMVQKRLLLLCILSQMVEMVESGVRPLVVNARHTYIFDVIEFIQASDNQRTAVELAERFHVSVNKLKLNFKEITGISVAAFCRLGRLQKAQALLDSTALELSQIAKKCGFSDESYFIESFRKFYGITPGAYRRNK